MLIKEFNRAPYLSVRIPCEFIDRCVSFSGGTKEIRCAFKGLQLLKAVLNGGAGGD